MREAVEVKGVTITLDEEGGEEKREREENRGERRE